MENKKEEVIVITKSWLHEIAEEQFEVKLTDEQLEEIEYSMLDDGGISDFLYDQVHKVLFENEPE